MTQDDREVDVEVIPAKATTIADQESKLGVAVFYGIEGSSPGGVKEAYQDPAVHTIIIHRQIADGGYSIQTMRRRAGSLAIREVVRPTDFCYYQAETEIWDVSYHRESPKYEEPIVQSQEITIPYRYLEDTRMEWQERHKPQKVCSFCGGSAKVCSKCGGSAEAGATRSNGSND